MYAGRGSGTIFRKGIRDGRCRWWAEGANLYELPRVKRFLGSVGDLRLILNGVSKRHARAGVRPLREALLCILGMIAHPRLSDGERATLGEIGH